MADTALPAPPRSPLAHDAGRLAAATRASGGAIRLAELPFLAQLNVRLDAKGAAAEAVGLALDLQLPLQPNTVVRAGELTALWLGPDEWLLIDESGTDLAALAAKADALHSAVDVSHRNTAVLVAGERAAEAIASASPHDLSPKVFPVGACARTVLGKIEVVIFRTGEQEYRVECWRSFAPYAFALLAEGAEDAGL